MKLRKKSGSRLRLSLRDRRNGGARLPLWAREVIGLVLLACSVFLLVSVFSYSPETDPGFFHQISPRPGQVQNRGGPVGSYAASFLKETLGLGAYFVGALVGLMALVTIGGRKVSLSLWKVPMGMIFLAALSTLISLIRRGGPSSHQGGLVGDHLANLLRYSLHDVGAYLLTILILVVSFICLGEVTLLKNLGRGLWALLRITGPLVQGTARGVIRVGRAAGSLFVSGARGLARLARSLYARVTQSEFFREKPEDQQVSQQAWEEALNSLEIEGPAADEPEPEAPRIPEIALQGIPVEPPAEEPASEAPAEPEAPKIIPLQAEGEPAPDSDFGPAKGRPRKVRQASLPFPEPIPKSYRPPPLELLDNPDPTRAPTVDRQVLLDGAKVLEQKLQDFGVEGRVTEIHPGPIITLYEYEPAPGIKVNRIVNLADDLALAMKAVSVRIVAPIPGKAVVGVEVPNPERQMVYLKEILASDAFQRSTYKLPLALGKDIAGQPFTTDLSRMPHLLIAGATGTGKSVCLHSLILSLVFRFSPQEVKFLIIDPKLLELSSYHGIPHLMHPVITDARRAQDVLDWAVERMEQRYQLLSEKGVRNIEGYNERLQKEMAASGARAEEEPEDELENGESEELDEGFLPEKGKLPYVILVIDEMADLMIVSGRQIEESITRLAQMARAAGIHLLLATQRPSVDVLTGIIKANLPTRLSFQVSSRTDSRTILDTIGAEKLLGQGDMLFLPPGTSKIRRIHGAYVTEPEIERVVEYLKQFGKPRYEKIPFRSKKTGKDRDEEEPFEEDEKYDEAVRLVTETRQASISMIQRKLRVGYNRAARMIERMEQQGIVGPQEGVKPREVLANSLE